MKDALRGGSFYWRYVHLRKVLKLIKRRARIRNTRFSILCYGSASYGFNPDNHGKFDDLDLFMVIPDYDSSDELLESIREIFDEEITVNEGHIQYLIDGGCDICRFYTHLEGIRVGFRIIPYKLFLDISHSRGSDQSVRNIASIGESRILVDQEWSFSFKKYVHVVYENFQETVAGVQVLVIIQRIFSKDKLYLGALGRKILTVDVVYEAPGQQVRSAYRRIWDEFVAISLEHHSDLVNDEIINSITRSERFSKVFRAKLSRIINSSRHRVR